MTWWSPFSMLSAEIVMEGIDGWRLPAFVANVFLLLNLDILLLDAWSWVRWRLAVMGGAFTLLSVVFLAWASRAGIQHQGSLHVLAVIAWNVAGAALFWLPLSRWWKTMGWGRATLLSLALYCWAFWCGFPWLGEAI